MGLIVVKEDFVGTYAIAQNAYTNLDQWIADYEEKYLIELLGAAFFDLFKANVLANAPAKVPSTPELLAIFNPFHYDVDRCLHISAGMKKMISGYIYFHFNHDNMAKNTQSGTVVNKVETSREANQDEADIYQRFNAANQTQQEIQWYICQHKIDYPLYNGKSQHLTHWALT